MRCFIAIDIPNEIKKKIEPLIKELNVNGIKPVEVDNLHITIKFLGEINEGKRKKVEKTLNHISFLPFSISLAGIGAFPNENYIRVIWIGSYSSELVDLIKEIDEKMFRLGFKRERDYVPHLTIARVKRRPEIDLKTFLTKYKSKEFGSFVVYNIKLKKSTLTSKGPIYEDVFIKSSTQHTRNTK